MDASAPQSFTIIVLPVNDPPVAIGKNYTAQANMKIAIPDGGTDLLVGASDIDGPAPLTVGSVSATTPAGGNVTFNAGTGAFDFDPPPGATGSVSFTYIVCDGDNLCGTPATVSFNVSGPVIWFVNGAVAGPGDGRLSNPFKTLASADAVDAANQGIFLLTGTYATGLGLNTGEALVGQGVTGASFDALFGISPPAGTIARPAINGTRPTVQSTVALAGSSTVRGLNIASTTATGLSAGAVTGVNVSETSVTSTTGTAVNLNGTGGSVSLIAVSSNGGTNGIVLNTTTGSFTVTGTGAAGTGGTIQNSTGNGITLNNVQNVSFNRMNIQSSGGHGINGATVNGFRLDNCLIENNGNNPFETGVDISNLTGTAIGGSNPTSITNTTIRNNFAFQLQITNTTGTLTDLQMSGNAISSTGASGTIANLFNFLGAGGGTGSLTLNLTSGTFTGAAPATATGLQCDHSRTSGAATCNISGATFTNNNVAVSVSQAQGGNLRFNVTGNTATGNRSHGLNLFVAAIGTGTVDGSFVNNIVGTQGVTGSGANLGFGIRVQNEGVNTTNPANVLISGNTVQEMTNFAGINVNQGIFAQPTSRSTNVTITNNTIRDVDNSRAIIVQQNNSTNTTGSAGVACADISGNEMNNIAGNVGDGTKIRLRQLAGGTFNLRQTSVADLAAANSPPNGVATTTTTTAQISAGGTITFNAGTCTQP